MEQVICRYCRKNPADTRKKYCSACRAKISAKKKADYEYWVLKGICVYCHKERADHGYKTCLSCRMDNRERCSRRYHNKSKDERHEIYEASKPNRRRRDSKLREAGICLLCGKRPAPEGFRTCIYCRSKMRRYDTRRRREAGVIPRSDMGNGLYCAHCACEVEEIGKKLCKKCSERNQVKLDLMHKNNAERNKEHLWSRENLLHFQKQAVDGQKYRVEGKNNADSNRRYLIDE